jgi:hypothetical protein
MIVRTDLEKFYQKGERIYVTFLDGEDQRKTLGGQIIQLIGDALIFKVKTSSEYDRIIVIYMHRLIKIEDIHENRYVV